MASREQPITKNIRLGPDGVYRWTYEMDMLRNPTILFTVWKVLGIAFGVVYLFTLLVSLLGGDLGGWAGLWSLTRGFLLLFGVFLVLGVLAYLILAGMYGGKYIVRFEMTDEYVKHIQEPMQAKKAEKLGLLTALVGLLARRPTVAGAGVLSASRSTSTSVFKNVEFLRVRRRRHVIHVDMLLDRNQVYAEDEDFDFVERFITERCVKAKRR